LLIETGSHYLSQGDIRFEILLPQPSQYWYYRSEPPCPAVGSICAGVENEFSGKKNLIIKVMDKCSELGNKYGCRLDEEERSTDAV
jgi:hypothetical protein